MRVVRMLDELPGVLLEAAASEALKSFGDAGVYLEKFIVRPRHVEQQVLTVHLGRRECSIQRRHQKLLEEGTSVAVDEELREGAAAVAAAEAVGYLGAGTRQFRRPLNRWRFYFLEMNTRIQVEHPVTELVYGVDLVREQLRIAAGLPMGYTQAGCIRAAGPSSVASRARTQHGTHRDRRCPAGPACAGTEADVGDEVTLHYDSMLAKLILGPEPGAGHRPDRGARSTSSPCSASPPTRAFTGGWPTARFRRRARHPVSRPSKRHLLPFVASERETLELAVAALAEDDARRRRRPQSPTIAPARPVSARAARRAPVTSVRVLRLAAGGDGVGKEDGRTVFVPRTAPGDLVELTGLRSHSRFARASRTAARPLARGVLKRSGGSAARPARARGRAAVRLARAQSASESAGR